MSNEIIIKLIISGGLIALVVMLRGITLRLVQKKEYHSPEAKIRAIANTKKLFLVVIILSLTFIWLTQLKDFALSLTAMAVAIVIATKELILCVSGGFLRNLSRSYRIGDRISIAEYRGDVVSIELMTTTLLEIGPGGNSHQYTGRSITIPNSLFLLHGVANETFTDEYILHIFSVPLSKDADIDRAEKILLSAADEAVADYKEQARDKMTKMGQKTGLEVPSVDPRVTIVIPDASTYSLLLRVPVPSLRKGKIEQMIIRRFLEEFRQKV